LETVRLLLCFCVIRGQTGSYTLGFVFLSGFALVCFAVNYLVFLRRQADRETAAAN
jgi:nitrate/nitrite transporter NarK